MQKMASMSDEQIQMQVDFMKNNREFAKNMMRQQNPGVPEHMLDAQIDNLSVDMMKSAMQMAKDNPHLA